MSPLSFRFMPLWLALLFLVGACSGDTQALEGERTAEAASPIVWAEQQKLFAADGAPLDFFGHAAALSADGNTALVGADEDDGPAGVNQGSAYVLVRSGNTWTTQAKLVAPDGVASGRFGISVALSGDGNTALIGADQSAASGGLAYVLVRSGALWTPEAELIPADGVAGDGFGRQVSLSGSGDTALIGAWYHTVGLHAAQGAAYVFERTGVAWAQQAQLVSADGAQMDLFGAAVALATDGNTVLVGAFGDDGPGGPDQGSAYVFVRSGGAWAPQAKLVAAAGGAYHSFGATVALAGDGGTALIGAPSDTNGGSTSQGSASVFVRVGGTWAEQAHLVTPSAAMGDTFGTKVALSADGSTALASDIGYGGGQGAAYVFARSGGLWPHQQTLFASGGLAGDYFGSAAALSANGRTALLGAPNDTDVGGQAQGSARVFAAVASANGVTCAQAADCQSGFCADGVCCDTACNAGACDACSLAAGATVAGTCALLTGAACDDGDACTQIDTCQQGACVGAMPVVCASLDECHTAGTCDPATGTCAQPAAPDGAPCDDGDACTQTDTCQQGACVGASPVLCLAQDECHELGACDATTGACDNPTKADGTSCSLGTCEGGTCREGSTGTGGAGGAGGTGGAGTGGAGTGGAGTGGNLAEPSGCGCEVVGDSRDRDLPCGLALTMATLLAARRRVRRRYRCCTDGLEGG